MHMADTALALQAHWSRLRPLILKAVPFMGGTHDEADLIKECLEGRMTFWPGEKSFLIAQVQKFPRQTRCVVVLANGDADECTRLRDRVEAWAKTQGATALRAELRPAGDRMAQRGHPATTNWKRGPTIYQKDL